MTATGARSPAVDEAPVGRFAAALARLWPEGGGLGLAVSGGPDSLAMLLLADAAVPGAFEVATVDHGLRHASADECATVAEICAARSIPCEILRVEVASGNLQAAAREARYAALAGWAARRGLGAIATAHHADDQAETLLMRLNRASGVAGLAGVRERAAVPGGRLPLLRPLLGFRRRELAEVVRAAGLEAACDPSNSDERFERARLRKALAAGEWLDAGAVAASAAHLADADEALEWAARREWDEHATVGDGEVRYRPQAPRAVALRVVERAVSLIGGPPRGRDAARLLDLLESGEGGNVAGVWARAKQREWVFGPEPVRKTQD